ncbi:MAG: PIG-L family deacetylase, partial [Dehalococcoidales bacterium]|nr:PIG-L family deacetylase [Dehalococcoidales bacterium]
MDKPTLLAVFAHPDDETVRSGGTLALLARRGVCVYLLTATHGEAGSCGIPPLCRPDELAALRERELACACQMLGLQPPRFLGYRDGYLPQADPDKVVGEIVRVVREVRPQVILTYGPDGISGHPDHVVIGRLALRAYREAGNPRAYAEAGLPPYSPAKLYQMVLAKSVAEATGLHALHSLPDEEISLTVDVSEVWDTKMAAICCHGTQHGVLPLREATPEQRRLFLASETFKLGTSQVAVPHPEHDMFDGLEPAVEAGQ